MKRNTKKGLEAAKELIKCGVSDALRYELEKDYPELKESEDEKIKHEIKVILANTDFSRFALDYTFADMINWLEKQQKPADVEEPNFFDDFRNSDVEVDSNEDGLIAETICYKEPKFKVKYAGSEYNVLEVKNITGVIFYGIKDEPNHIDYVKAENCEIISGYAIKENGSPYPTKPAVFSEQKSWSKEDERIYQSIIDDTVQENQLDNRQINWIKSLKKRINN